MDKHVPRAESTAEKLTRLLPQSSMNGPINVRPANDVASSQEASRYECP